MEQAHDETETMRAFSVSDFKVPQRNLSLLVGAEAAAQLLTRAGIPHGAEADETAMLPSITFLNLCLEHIRNADDESYGVAPNPVPKGAFGLLMAAASQADRFDDALQRFAEAAKILRPDLSVKVHRGRERLQLTLQARQPRSARTEFMTEIFAVTVQSAFRWLTGARLRPLHVRIAERMPGFERTVLTILRCPTPQHGEGVTLCYAPGDAATPILPVKYQHWAAQELGEFMRLLEEAAHEINHARPRHDASLAVRVADLVADGAYSESEAAAKLGMSAASLRRRLAEAGCSFRSVVSDVQRSAASSLLVTDRSLEDIAQEIGFSDTRSLRRACQRWFGMTPAEYRLGHKQPRRPSTPDTPTRL